MNILKELLHKLETHSKKNAFFIDDKYYTYHDFEKEIKRIYRYLLPLENEKIICVITSNDLSTYAAIISIWFTGKTFVPVNPLNPISRNKQILKSTSAKTVLSSSPKSYFDIKNEICISSIEDSNIDIKLKNDLASFAYILFTSGSTGVPKGVPITWRNLISFFDSFIDLNMELDSDDRFLQLFDFSFDVSIISYLLPLVNGGCVFTIPNNEVKYLHAYDLLKEKNITVATLVPSVLSYLKPYFDEINLLGLRYCILTAEASYNDLISLWEQCIPNAIIYNLYGPTEATIWCFNYRWKMGGINDEYNGLTSIGKPMKNVTAILRDNKKIITKVGIKGELCISGEHITNGYWENEIKNKESFFSINLDGEIKRFYKTGDICYINDNGEYMYCGRIDHQVQIQGFRVELSELEHPVRKHFKISNVAAIPYRNRLGSFGIQLFIGEEKIKEKQVKLFLKSCIPSYMLPDKIHVISEFPINNSGKIDRKKLYDKINKNE